MHRVIPAHLYAFLLVSSPVLTSDSTTLSSKGVGGLFWAGSLRPTELSLFMQGGLAAETKGKHLLNK